jgi:hypothetical protein
MAAAELAHKDSVIVSYLTHQASGSSFKSRLPIMRTCESDLEMLASRLNLSFPPLLDRLYSVVKLRLYSYALLGLRKDDELDLPGVSPGAMPAQAPLEVMGYISKTYSVVLHVINSSVHALDGRWVHASATSLTPLGGARRAECAPWTFIDFQALVFSVFLLLHIRHIYPSIAGNSETQDAIHRAWTFLKACSVAEGDHFHRVCDIIHYISTEEHHDDTVAEDEGPADGGQGTGTDVAYSVVRMAQKRYRSSWKRYPDKFSDAGDTDADGATATKNQEQDWLQSSAFADVAGSGLMGFEFPLWPSWESGQGFSGAFPSGFS